MRALRASALPVAITAYAALCVELIIRGVDSKLASAFIALAAG